MCLLHSTVLCAACVLLHVCCSRAACLSPDDRKQVLLRGAAAAVSFEACSVPPALRFTYFTATQGSLL